MAEGAGKKGEEKTDGVGKPTIYDVAQKAGVSFVSVSRVFNDHPNVSEHMRQRVFQAARDLGYQARLVSRPEVLGFVVHESEHMRHGTDLGLMCGHLFKHAHAADMLTRMVPFSQIDQLIRHGVCGLVEVGLQKNPLDGKTQLPKIPVVLTQLRATNSDWASVTVDYRQEAELALSTMVEKGHRRIAILLSDLQGWTADVRLKAMKQKAADLGLGTSALHDYCSCDGPFPSLAGKLRKNGDTCLINFDTDRLPELLDYFFNESDLRIPGDLSLLTLDNTGLCAHYHPRVSHIEQPLEKLAQKAIELLKAAPHSSNMNMDLQFASRLILCDTTPDRT